MSLSRKKIEIENRPNNNNNTNNNNFDSSMVWASPQTKRGGGNLCFSLIQRNSYQLTTRPSPPS